MHTYTYLPRVKWWRAFQTQLKLAGRWLTSCSECILHELSGAASRVRHDPPALSCPKASTAALIPAVQET